MAVMMQLSMLIGEKLGVVETARQRQHRQSQGQPFTR